MSQTSSVVTSLVELAHMEEERVRQQVAASEREREAEERARRSAEESVRAEAQALERAREAAVREAARREREEAARGDAMHRAAIEAARVAAENRARAEERERDRRHELEIARLQQTGGRAKTRTVALGALLGAGVAGALAATLYMGIAVPHSRAAERQARMEAESREEAAIDALRTRVAAADARVGDLESALKSAQSEGVRLRSALDDAARELRSRRGPGRPPSLPRSPSHEASGLDGFAPCSPGSADPMCLH